MLWRVAILDDEREYISLITSITKEYMLKQGFEYEIKTYTSSKDLINDYNAGQKYMIYLLDVEVPDMNGIEVAKLLRLKYWDSFIIYITNHIQYAVPAFEVNTFRYIPKNMLEEKLPDAYDAIKNVARRSNKQRKYYNFEIGGEGYRIKLSEILYLMKDGKYVKIVCKKQSYKVRKNLGDILREIDSEDLLVIERGYAVNMQHVTSVRDRQVQLDNETKLFVAYARWKAVKDAFLELGE